MINVLYSFERGSELEYKSFSSRAAALLSRVSGLRRSKLARACTPLTKSEEIERLLAVILHNVLL